MRLALTFAALLLLESVNALGSEPCQQFHGRAHFYGGDGQLRIWHIGTHHEFEPDPASEARVLAWLEAGVPDAEKSNYANPAAAVMLFGDFTLCPVEPFRHGAVQRATVLRVRHKRFVRLD